MTSPVPGDTGYSYTQEELLQTDRSWLKKRNCAGVDPNLFFHEGREDTNPHIHEDNIEAIRVCLGCEVKRECLIECAGTDYSWRFGIWAGTTPGTRKLYMKRHLVVSGAYDFTQLENPMSYKKVLTQKAS